MYGADRDKDEGCNEDWMVLVFWKGEERVSRDFSRFLPSRGGREWVIYRPFRILDDSGNLRYEASSVEPEDRAICLAKKSAKTELDRRTVFIARSRTNFCSLLISFLHFSLVFLSWLSKDFPMISPNALFHPPSLSGMEFLFSTSFEKFSPYYSKIFFFSFLSKSINRFHKVIVIFF